MPATSTQCGNGDRLRVVPGDANDSLLVEKLDGTAGCGARMPSADSPLPPESIARLRAWIEAGAVDD